MHILKQSTASQSVVIGPFVDDADAVTLESGLTIANTDIRLSKNGGNIAAKNSGGATYDEAGMYAITLDNTDTDTVGRLQLIVNASGALPVYHEFQVVEEAVYDNMFGSGAVGPLTAAAVNAECDTALSDYDPPTKAELDSAHSTTDGLITTVDTVVDGIQTDLSNGTDGLGAIKAETALIVADTNELQTDWANGGRLDNLLDATALEATVAALNDLSAAEVNAEVDDVLSTDTIAEMSQGAPPLAPTAVQAINYLYRELIRNKVVVDTDAANQKQVFADDGSTILYEKDLTNASNVTTVAEATTGA